MAVDWLDDHSAYYAAWWPALAICLAAIAVLLLSARLQGYANKPALVFYAAAIVVEFTAVRSLADVLWASLVVLIGAGCVINEACRLLLARILTALLAGHAIATLCAYLIQDHQFYSPGFGMRASEFYGTPNGIYPILLTALFWFLSQTLDGSTAIRATFATMSLLAGAAIALTFTRTATFGALAGLGVFGALTQHRNWRPLAVGAVLLTGCIFLRTSAVGGGSNAIRSIEARPAIWQDASILIRTSPIFGHGDHAFRRYRNVLPGAKAAIIYPDEPKSLYVSALVEKGFVGLFVLLGACYFLVRDLVRKAREGSDVVLRWVPIAAVSIVAAMLVAGLGDTPLWGDLSRLPATFAFSLSLGLAGPPSASRGTRSLQ